MDKVNNDKSVEICAVGLATFFLGFLSAYFINNNLNPTAKEFAPIYFGAGILAFTFFKGGIQTGELRAFAKQYPFSFGAHLSMIVAGLFFFLYGQIHNYGVWHAPPFVARNFSPPDIKFFSAICGWVFVHFSARCVRKDLLKKFSDGVIRKYVEVPPDGWVMGLLIYHLVIRGQVPS